jgi:hypothetical protein
MVAVRALLSSFNGLAQAGSLARGWLGSGQAAGDGHARSAAPAAEPADDGAYAHAGDEPPLEDLLQDPVVRLVMDADRLEPAQVRRLLRAKQAPVVR